MVILNISFNFLEDKMTIRLDNYFTIDIDTIGNHSLTETQKVKSGKNKGNDYRVIHGHYRDIAGAVRKYLEINALGHEEQLTLIQFLDRYEKLLKDVETKFKKDVVR